MRWITRERPKVDRVACPWLISRFIDKGAEFIFVPPDEVIEKGHHWLKFCRGEEHLWFPLDVSKSTVAS